ncbi:Arf-GAP domain and FG repeat-containing protein 1 [Lamellibrachia satsuma]|nr:Arf-GAP domain and FG repeat-containing protein 1 [Lamellibrachia satsuma]
MTLGAFVCTSCSGLLRGLNPPHRVKSISMMSFTPEEMDYLSCHGNDGKPSSAGYDQFEVLRMAAISGRFMR